MCKILNIAGINNDKKDMAWKFIHEMGKEMSKGNDDGLGYTAIDEHGDMFGERWLNNGEAFKTRAALSELDKKLIETFNGCISKEDKYNYFGNANENIVAITLHTRMATSDTQFYNTHPFVLDDVSLIHNGVIRNTSSLINTMSTCDSECILHEYVDNEVSRDVNNFQKVVDKLEGYFALGVFGIDNECNRYLDIIKDDKARLYAAYVEQLGTMVFTTDISDVYKVCKKLKFKVVSHYEVINNVVLRLDAVTGKAYSSCIFKPNVKPMSTTYNSMTGWEKEYDKSTQQEKSKALTYNDIAHIQDWERTGDGTWKKVCK